MKKALVILMALVMVMSLVCASAEVATVGFYAVADLEGNVIEGDFSAYEGATMTIDDEANTLVFNDGTNPETNYTLQLVEQTEEAIALLATSEDGSEEIMLYYAVAEDGAKTVSMIVDESMMIIFSE